MIGRISVDDGFPPEGTKAFLYDEDEEPRFTPTMHGGIVQIID